MLEKILFISFVCLMLGLSLFFIIYGVKGGLIDKQIMVNGWTHKYVTGHDAEIRGCFYIGIGVLFLVVLLLGLVDAWTRGI